jgi:competence CoiA-like predicted nuclease
MLFDNRSIKEAFDRKSKKLIKAEDVFHSQGDGFRLREASNDGTLDLECVACKQDLGTPVSGKGNVYFRHFPKSDDCILKDIDISDEIAEGYYRAFEARESERHKELKSMIGVGLYQVSGVDSDSINIDKKFIIRGGKKRRPDVYCIFNTLELAFEIQLSNLPLRYIIHRHEFYKRHGIFLIWVLDGTNPRLQTNLERDIKNLNSFHNLFKLNEGSVQLQFDCSYKVPFIFQQSAVHQKWLTKSITLNDFNFSTDTIEPYYYDYPTVKIACEQSLADIREKARQKEIEVRKQAHIEQINRNITSYRNEIANYKERNFNFFPLFGKLDRWEAVGTKMLNENLKLYSTSKDNLPALIYYILNQKKTRRDSDISFVEYLIREERIWLDVNAKVSSGSGCLQAIYEQHNLKARIYKLLPAIFKRGYRLTDFDRNYFKEEEKPEYIESSTIYKLEYLNRLSDKNLADTVLKDFLFLLFIESALQGKILGTKVKYWVQFIDGKMNRYSQWWFYSKRALEKNGTWQMVLAEDKKGTLQRKIKELKLEEAQGDFEMAEVLNQLFPELFF